MLVRMLVLDYTRFWLEGAVQAAGVLCLGLEVRKAGTGAGLKTFEKRGFHCMLFDHRVPGLVCMFK